jgi:hypothetical protein
MAEHRRRLRSPLMQVELGAPVVLRQDEAEIWHLPKPAKKMLEHVEISIDDGLRRMATSWPALCDHVAGEVWVYDGLVRRRRLCRGCAFLNNGETHHVPPSELEAIDHHEALRAELGTSLDLEAA